MSPRLRFWGAMQAALWVFPFDRTDVIRADVTRAAEVLRKLANTAHGYANELERAELVRRGVPPGSPVLCDEQELERCGCGKPAAHPLPRSKGGAR